MCQLEGPPASPLLPLQPQEEPNSLLARPAGPWDGVDFHPSSPCQRIHLLSAMQGQGAEAHVASVAKMRQMHMKNGDCPRHL